MIEVKESAIKYFDKIANGKVVTFGLRGAGCAGFSYDFNIIEKHELDDSYDIIEYENFILAIDKTSSMYLMGSELDFVSDIIGSRIDVKNPLVKNSCGCNMSVNF